LTAAPRRIAVVTSSRADYGHLVWPLRELAARPGVELRLIAFGSHLSPTWGDTIAEIERDGFEVAHRVECLLSSDRDVGMAKTIGVATLSLADILAAERPDLLLIIADRYEMLAPASVALALRIPIAHIEGGELSEGAIDQAVRDALTKMAHLHLVPTRRAEARVLSLGEEPWRVHRVGAPSLDHLRRSEIPAAAEVAARHGASIDSGHLVVAYHPVTLDPDPAAEADAFFAALRRVDRPLVFCFPNADAGSYALQERARRLAEERPRTHLFVNLPHLEYWGLLREAAAIVGNSSSGIMEAPAIPIPAVDVGRRQQGRERAACVIGAPPEAEGILAAIERVLSEEFRSVLPTVESPYGDGTAGERIAELLAGVELGDRLLDKRVLSIDP